MPLVQTRGAASAQGFGEFAQVTAANYIEDMFSCFLYTGNGSTQTINNGIDLAGKGGLVWLKDRGNTGSHRLVDTVRGNRSTLFSESTSAAVIRSNDVSCDVSSFNSNGFTAGNFMNQASNNYVSWSFAETPKFFDVVTYTGTGVAGRTVAHNLGSVPGSIIIKCTSHADNWYVHHRSVALPSGLFLNATIAAENMDTRMATLPTSTVFTVETDAMVNASGRTYVAYLFAHNAGGFGLTGTDNVISCGSYVGSSSSDVTINLGYEVQFVMVKNITTAANWQILDVMRGMPLSGNARTLAPNLADQESGPSAPVIVPTATGMTIAAGLGTALNTDGSNYIYIAIRRGPMRVPTTGTSVFGLNARTGTGANATVTGSAGVTDLAIIKNRGSTPVWAWASRLTGTGYLSSNATTAEVAAGTTILQANPWDVMDGVKVGTTSTITNASANTYINYLLDRAPGFFDEVCFTATGASQSVNHNLQAVPELMICKRRNSSTAGDWTVYSAALGNTKILYLNQTAAQDTNNNWDNTTPTSTTFNVNNNISGGTYVNYLFATCPGVSKVGSYTGTGTTQTINCGFTAGSRFIMIKRTDSTGSWYVWDSARGIVAGNDPYLLLNSTAAEVTNTDFVDTAATGFEISSTAPAEINASGGTYIFLAIA